MCVGAGVKPSPTPLEGIQKSNTKNQPRFKIPALMRFFSKSGLICLLILSCSLRTVAQTRTIGTYAGAPLPLPGTPAAGYAMVPSLLTVDPFGGFYLISAASTGYETILIYRVTPDSSVQWVAGSIFPDNKTDGPVSAVAFRYIRGMVADRAGNLFVSDADYNRIRKISRAGTISTIAGTGGSFGGDGGPAASAGFNSPGGLALGPEGSLYVIDSYRIRKITPAGIITTVAGGNTSGFSGDGGPATSAQFSNLSALAVDASGNLYVTDSGNNRIRKIAANSTITTIVGGGVSGDASSATAVRLSNPSGLALDANGNLYFTEREKHIVRKVTPAGIISTVAGVPSLSGYTGDGRAATFARLDNPGSVIVDDAGGLYVADAGNFRVRRISTDGIIETVAGNGYYAFGGDGGRAIHGQIRFPIATTMDLEGNLYIADAGNVRIRKVSACGEITTVAGNGTYGFSGDGEPATQAALGAINASGLALATDALGNLYIGDAYNSRIRRVTPDGIINTIAGGRERGTTGDGGPAVDALIFGPTSLAFDLQGNLYIGGGNKVRKINRDGIITTVAGNGMYTYDPRVGDGGPAIAASFAGPSSIAIDAAGNLYIGDDNNGSVRRVTADGRINTVAGGGTSFSIPDGAAATSGRLFGLNSMAIDAAGNLYITHSYPGNRVRKVTPDGIITTVAGTEQYGYSEDGGPATSALLWGPSSLTLDAMGNLYFSERETNRIRIVYGVASPQTRFSISNLGSLSLKTAGCSATTSVGYARVQSQPGSTAPDALAIMQLRQGNVLVGEASVPAAAPILQGRIYAEVAGNVNTGLAIVNPNGEAATLSFDFIGDDGSTATRTITLAANQQMAAFLDQPPFSVPSGSRGALSFTSSVPAGVIALRGLTNERGEFLITTLPVVDVSVRRPVGASVVPHFAAGGGWSTELVLVNVTDSPITGTVVFVNQAGQPATVTVRGQQGSIFRYDLPPRGGSTFKTSDVSEITNAGSIRVVPNGGEAPPAFSIFSYTSGGTTVSEAGVAAVNGGMNFRLYADAAGPVQTGVAVTNLLNTEARVNFELYLPNGSPSGISGTLNVPANGQVARFVNQIAGFPSLPPRGVLRISSATPIAVVGLRGRYNERNEFLVTTIPAVNESDARLPESVLPHFPDGGGYTTQFILFAGGAGDLRFLSRTGENINPTVH